MDIYLGNLPAQTKTGNLALMLAAFSDSFRLTLYEQEDPEGENNYYGHVSCMDRTDSQQVISRLNGLIFHGRELIAREYVKRSEARTAQLQQPEPERRGRERSLLGSFTMDDNGLKWSPQLV